MYANISLRNLLRQHSGMSSAGIPENPLRCFSSESAGRLYSSSR